MNKHPNVLAIRGTHDANTLEQLNDVASRAVYAALQADGHLGYIMPVGGVCAYRNQVSVAGNGYDIGCGCTAIQTDIKLSALSGIDSGDVKELAKSKLNELADTIWNTISFGIGRKNSADDAPVNDLLFEDPAWYVVPRFMREDLRQKARNQLGTVGSGNHYVDVLVDQAGFVWVGVHFGSRGLGHTIAGAFMALAGGVGGWGTKAPEVEGLLPLDSQLGTEYWQLMNLAQQYASIGRRWVTRKVVAMFGGRELFLVDNHHNASWKETHFGEELVVVRKGATPAFPGQFGFVGGSMGDDAVILSGVDSPDSAQLLYSTVHGAGRVMSRTQAAGKTKRRKVWKCGQRNCGLELPIQTKGIDGANPKCPTCSSKMHRRESAELVRPGRVTPDMMQSWLNDRGVILKGGGLDESPHAYRRLPDVLAAQGDTVQIEHVLRPVIVCMAGPDIRDPYAD